MKIIFFILVSFSSLQISIADQYTDGADALITKFNPSSCINLDEAKHKLRVELIHLNLKIEITADDAQALVSSLRKNVYEAYYSGIGYYTTAYDLYDDCEGEARSCYLIYKVDCDGIVSVYVDDSED